MKASSLLTLLVSAGIASGCGARTSEDDLLLYSRVPGAGGPRTGVGGTAAIGGGFGVGGNWGVGGSGGASTSSSCCTASDGPGCEDPSTQACVCGLDPYCCANLWDETCVQFAEIGCGLVCGAGGSPGVGGLPGTGGLTGVGGFPTTGGQAGIGGLPGSGGHTGVGGSIGGGGSGGQPPHLTCCEPHGDLGCEDPRVTECVCGADPFCCNSQWDQLCADRADSCGASCGGGSGGTGGAGTGGVAGVGGGAISACEETFPGDCGSCVCNNCFHDLNECLSKGECTPLLICEAISGCPCGI